MLSSNSFRASFIYSNLFFVTYHIKIEDINNKLTWGKQVVTEEKKDFTLSYATSKVGKNNLANKATDYNSRDKEKYSNIEVTILNNTLISQGEDMAITNINIYITQGL